MYEVGNQALDLEWFQDEQPGIISKSLSRRQLSDELAVVPESEHREPRIQNAWSRFESHISSFRISISVISCLDKETFTNRSFLKFSKNLQGFQDYELAEPCTSCRNVQPTTHRKIRCRRHGRQSTGSPSHGNTSGLSDRDASSSSSFHDRSRKLPTHQDKHGMRSVSR
jgi:hypothetical protein